MPGQQARRPIALARNSGAFLLGVSWVHDRSWIWRTTHFYLGFWTLTFVKKTRGSKFGGSHG